MKKLLKIFNTRSPSAGFTLIELLVAMAITTIVVGLTGFGVVAITARNKRETFETNRRVELNRALDFIADEVRQAKPIATDASANLSTVAPGFNSSGKTPVLTLQIPGVPQRVIYYIKSPVKSPPSEKEPWFGPKVIYRWGPMFNSNGQYQEDKKANDPPAGCSSPSDCNPKNWQYEALVDQIVDTAPSSTPCPNGTLNPASSITGFYACVDSTGRIADVHLRGKLTDAYNNARDPLEVSTKVFARPYTLTFTTGGSSSTDPGAGTITITQPSTVYFEIIGGDTSGIPTTTTINQTLNGSTANKPINASTKALNVSAATGTTLTVTGRASSFSTGGKNFGGFDANSETDKTTQVWTLRNGYTPPPFNAYQGQLGIDAIVAKHLDANGKIKLAENQVIYLFEVITKDQTHQFYDMQDIVVLATVTPS